VKRIIDTHAHLDHTKDLARVLDSAAQENVAAILAVSEDLQSSKDNLEIKKKFSNSKIFVACGIHPSKAHLIELDACVNLIRENKNELSAIGEIGLDYWYNWVKKNEDKKEEQRKVFIRLIELAKELNLPAAIHSRGAWEDCFDIADKVGIKNCVFHWYSGPVETLKKIIGKGFFISATPSLEYSPEAQKAIKYAPLENTLIETDSPVFYKTKDAAGGFTAEPKDVWRTLKLYCELKNVDSDFALNKFNENAAHVFKMNCV